VVREVLFEAMSKVENTTSGWTDADTESLFSVLGKYWISFQWVEGLLDQSLLLAWDHDNWAASQKKLAKMSNAQKINELEKVVLNSPDFARVHKRPEWVERFKSFMKALHEERERRNTITHSQILFDLAERGLGPPLLSNRVKLKGGEASFEQNYLSKEFQNEMLGRIAKLAFEMNFICVQLRHDYRAQT
jgi:hypothetical protein